MNRSTPRSHAASAHRPCRSVGLCVGWAAWVLLACACGHSGDEASLEQGGAGALPDAASAAPASAVATLESVKGEVTLVRGGQRRAAPVGPLLAQDAVETGASGGATLRFADGRVVEIGPDAQLSLAAEAGGGVVLRVEQGLVLSRVPKAATTTAAPGGPAAPGGKVALSILTPFGLTRLQGPQSQVSVEVKPDAARVDVQLGQVEFVSRNGQATRATAGEQLTADARAVQRRVLELAPIVVIVHAEGVRAELRQAGATRWRPLAGSQAALAEGDSVRAKAGQPVLTLGANGGTAQLATGAEVALRSLASGRGDDAGADHDGADFGGALELTRGALTLQLPTEHPSRVRLGGVWLRAEAGGRFDVARTREGLAVSAIAGDATVVRDAAGELPATVRAGQTAQLGARGAATLAQQQRSELSLPSTRGVHVFHQGALSSVTLGWDGGARDYRVEVASDPAFEHPLVDGLVHAAQVTVPAPRRGALYWKALDPVDRRELAHGSATFAPEPARNDLARPRNEVADGAEKTTIFYQDKAPAVTFTFRPEAGAARFRVQVYRVDQMDRPVAERVVADTRLPLEAGTLREGRYLWSVTPLGAHGEPLRGARMNKLELTYDNSTPWLVVLAPREGEQVRAGPVKTRGIVPVGGRLWLNARPAALDPKGRFEGGVLPIGSPPVIIYRLSRPGTPDAFTVRTLRRGS